MVVQVVAEELNVRDRGVCDERIGEMAREQNEGHVANVLGVVEPRYMTDFQWRFTRRVEYLRCGLNGGQSTGIHKLLHGRNSMITE